MAQVFLSHFYFTPQGGAPASSTTTCGCPLLGRFCAVWWCSSSTGGRLWSLCSSSSLSTSTSATRNLVKPSAQFLPRATSGRLPREVALHLQTAQWFWLFWLMSYKNPKDVCNNMCLYLISAIFGPRHSFPLHPSTKFCGDPLIPFFMKKTPEP